MANGNSAFGVVYSGQETGMDGSTAFKTPTLQTPTVLYYGVDHLGTVRAVVQVDESGNETRRSLSTYEPVGLEIPPIDACDNTHRFTGHERDPETDTDYMHFRYYAGSMGRFAKPDNVTGNAMNPQDWNLYSYVHGNPITLDDPTGHGTDESLGAKADSIETKQTKDEGVTQDQKENLQKVKQVGGGVLKIVLGVTLVASALGGDAPGGVLGALILTSVAMGGTATAVSGTTDVLGATTNTDVSKAQEALDATGNLPGLVSTVASGGNLKVGKAVSTTTDVAQIAIKPKDAAKTPATAVEAGRAVVKETKAINDWQRKVKKAICGEDKPKKPKKPNKSIKPKDQHE